MSFVKLSKFFGILSASFIRRSKSISFDTRPLVRTIHSIFRWLWLRVAYDQKAPPNLEGADKV